MLTVRVCPRIVQRTRSKDSALFAGYGLPTKGPVQFPARGHAQEDWMAAMAWNLANRILDFGFKTAILDLV
jgi:hypothetical protein